MSKELYAVLGVPEDAASVDIKKAYKKKAHRLHPDRETGDEVEFKKLVAAYEVLIDEARRRHYDETGDTAPAREAAFISEAMAILLHLIDNTHEVEYVDIIGEARKIVEGAISKAEAAVASIEGRIADRRKVIERLSCKKENLLSQGIESSIRQCEQEAVKAKALVKEGKMIHDFLRDYSYAADTRPRPSYGSFGASGFFIRTGGGSTSSL